MLFSQIIIATTIISLSRAYTYITGEDFGSNGFDNQTYGVLENIHDSTVDLPFPKIPPCHTMAYTRIKINYVSGRDFKTLPRIYYVRRTTDMNNIEFKMDLYEPPTDNIAYDIRVKAKYTCGDQPISNYNHNDIKINDDLITKSPTTLTTKEESNDDSNIMVPGYEPHDPSETYEGLSSSSVPDAEEEANEGAGEEANDGAGEEANDGAGDEAGRDAAQEAGHDPAQEAGDDAAQEASHDSAQEAGHDPAQQAGDDANQEAGHDAAPEAGHDAAEEAGNDPAQEASHDAAQKAGYDLAQEAGHDLAQEPGQDLPQEPERAPPGAAQVPVQAQETVQAPTLDPTKAPEAAAPVVDPPQVPDPAQAVGHDPAKAASLDLTQPASLNSTQPASLNPAEKFETASAVAESPQVNDTGAL